MSRSGSLFQRGVEFVCVGGLGFVGFVGLAEVGGGGTGTSAGDRVRM